MVAADAAEAAADGPGEPVLQRCGSPGQSEESLRKKFFVFVFGFLQVDVDIVDTTG